MTKDEYMEMYNVVGAAMKVHEVLGRGLEEAIYQESLEIEMRNRDMIPEREKSIDCFYRGIKLKKHYVADFYYNGIIIELKAVNKILPEHRAQLFNYMRLTHTNRGLLINFFGKHLYAERYWYLEHIDDFILLTEDNFKDYIED